MGYVTHLDSLDWLQHFQVLTQDSKVGQHDLQGWVGGQATEQKRVSFWVLQVNDIQLMRLETYSYCWDVDYIMDRNNQEGTVPNQEELNQTVYLNGMQPL